MTTEDYIRSEQHGKSKGKKEIWMKHMLAGPTVNMNQNFLPCVKFSNTANIYFHFWGGHCLLFMHLDNYFKAGCHWRIAPVYITSLRQLEAVFTCYGPRIVVFSPSTSWVWPLSLSVWQSLAKSSKIIQWKATLPASQKGLCSLAQTCFLPHFASSPRSESSLIYPLNYWVSSGKSKIKQNVFNSLTIFC